MRMIVLTPSSSASLLKNQLTSLQLLQNFAQSLILAISDTDIKFRKQSLTGNKMWDRSQLLIWNLITWLNEDLNRWKAMLMISLPEPTFIHKYTLLGAAIFRYPVTNNKPSNISLHVMSDARASPSVGVQRTNKTRRKYLVYLWKLKYFLKHFYPFRKAIMKAQFEKFWSRHLSPMSLHPGFATKV